MGQDRTKAVAGGKRKINKTREMTPRFDGWASSRPPWLLMTPRLDGWASFRRLWLLMRCEYKEEDSIMGLSTDPWESNQTVLSEGSLENMCLLRDS